MITVDIVLKCRGCGHRVELEDIDRPGQDETRPKGAEEVFFTRQEAENEAGDPILYECPECGQKYAILGYLRVEWQEPRKLVSSKK